MNSVEVTPGMCFTGSDDFIAGVISAASILNIDIIFEHDDKVGNSNVASCGYEGPSLSFSDVKNKSDLCNFIADLIECEPKDVDNLIDKRYVHLALFPLKEVGGFQRIRDTYILFQFDTFDFIKGMDEAAEKYNITISHDIILDTRTYTHVLCD
jgi:hypothetical protein